MKKQQLVDKLERAWNDFTAAYSGVSAEQMQQPGVGGDWSVKDIIAHVTTWEQEALKYLPLILQGGRPPRYSVLYGGIDAFNAQMTEKKRAFSLAEIVRDAEETHHRLVAYVEGMPDAQVMADTPFRRRLRLDTYSHYPIHTQSILEWRRKEGL